MERVHFDEAVKKILQKDNRYKPDGYDFLREALGRAIKANNSDELEEHRHVTGPELLEGIVNLAADEFGIMAVTILDSWGIRDGEDVGNMVFNLIDAGAFGRSEEDSPTDFVGVIDLKERLLSPYRPTREVLAKKSDDGESEPPTRGNQPAKPREI
ncbi:MAG: hypothetical protein CMO55_14185 [Verrucomicrobiales bacterium]|nr:hypothetical protein [Verrucomicrobiales bacterium]